MNSIVCNGKKLLNVLEELKNALMQRREGVLMLL